MIPSFTAVSLVFLQALRSCAHRQSPFDDARRDGFTSSETWKEKYGAQPDLLFTGPLAFSHLPYFRCLEDAAAPAFDIALLGMPFDTTVTFRPGARFGPAGIRTGSRRISPGGRSWSLAWGLDPYEQGVEIIDCGDVSISCTVFFFS
jgi:agmatinase